MDEPVESPSTGWRRAKEPDRPGASSEHAPAAPSEHAPTAPAAGAGADRIVHLSLISHTNAGKTTLARTLLARDVGEVRDAPHVTGEAESHLLAQTDAGERLLLWDTPGFGDSARLAARLAHQGSPVGWLLTEVWDRWRDRPFWSAQQALRNVREHADVVLYLVNASEDPADAGYLDPELRILAWMDKPVIALLNQTGPPRPPEQEQAEFARWRERLAPHAFVRAVLPLDAFARCWVQEAVLLRKVAAALPAARRPAFARLQAAWLASRMATFDASIAALAAQLARAAGDREPVDDALLRNALREAGRAMGLARHQADGPREHAMRALAQRLEDGVRASTDRLIALHGLSGNASAEVLARVAEGVRLHGALPEGRAAVLGGFVSGALGGLAADLATGGLSFGAGMLAGGVLGALGAAGLARGFNLVRGAQGPALRWEEAFLDGLVAQALLRYLAVAHYGRGRGDWAPSEHPQFWVEAVDAVVGERRAGFASAWARAHNGATPDEVAALLRAPLAQAARALLERLYPGALGGGSGVDAGARSIDHEEREP